MPPSPPISMSELARLAGVNISTVSRALDDSPLVKQKTKDKIKQLAEETGYSINAQARNLRKQSSQTLGIIIPVGPETNQTVSDPFFLEMVGAASEAASKRGYDLIIRLPREKSEIAERRLLGSGKADGLIIIGQAGRTDRLKALGDSINRVVVWGGMIDDPDYTLVGSNNFEGGRLIGQHLAQTGRRRIAFLGDIRLPEVRLRYEGFVAALDQAGIKHPDNLVFSTSFVAEDAQDVLRAAITRGETFDAIAAASDVLAMSAITVLQEHGLKVPDDVAVTGYDNIGQSKLATPPLTTIDQSIALGGEMLVDLLLRKIAGEKVASQMTPTSLIIRQSTGVPA